MNRTSAIDSLKGIGEKTKLVFEKAGVRTVDDLLLFYPRTYVKFEPITLIDEAAEEQKIAVCARIERALTVQHIKRFQMVSTVICDESGSIAVRWYNMPYLKNTIKKGALYVFCGKVVRKSGKLLIEQPSLYSPEQYYEMLHVLQPVYALTKGLSNNMVCKAVRQAIDEVELSMDYLSSDIREKYQLAGYDYAIEEIHFPKDDHHMLLARKRLVFDEFFLFILALRRFKEQNEKEQNAFHIERLALTDQVISGLKYDLTGAQKKVWEEIQQDMTSDLCMARLVQGDVGSGKTIVAFLAMILSAGNGLQSALMVPTEVLARQHYDALLELFEKQNLPFRAVLLTGSMTAREKRLANEKIVSGEADMIIGTHALIQEGVQYQKLGLVITDEQHRFGVRQREILGEKGCAPHTLVMSATPIPRTLAVILYGDLSISVIDELPANRLPIKNCVVNTGYRPTAYHFIENEIRKGRQAYIICPMVEESEMIEAEDVMNYTKRMQEVFPSDIVVSALHGKMKPKEKNAIMEQFLRNEIQILVSTTVIEVGVNVPNASVMMIENAERFGLAQLHQLRGRVGRGDWQSYCIMMYGGNSTKPPKRLEILNKSNDGFYIAGEDLKLRGPGDILGVRQSGMLEFKLGDVYTDAAVLQAASDTADAVLAEDPLLEMPKNAVLKRKLDAYMSDDLKNLSL